MMRVYDGLRNQYWRDPVVAYAILEAYDPEGSRAVLYRPVIAISENESGQAPLPLVEGEEVVGVVPATPGTFAVYGLLADESWHFLGYEHPGASALDWDSLLAEKRLAYERGELEEE
jgi:hypothetical protein